MGVFPASEQQKIVVSCFQLLCLFVPGISCNASYRIEFQSPITLA